MSDKAPKSAAAQSESPKAFLVLATHPDHGPHRALVYTEAEANEKADHWAGRGCTLEIEPLYSIDQLEQRLSWEEFRKLANEAFGQSVDRDLRGNPITDYDVLLMGAYAPAIKRLVELAVTRLTVEHS